MGMPFFLFYSPFLETWCKVGRVKAARPEASIIGHAAERAEADNAVEMALRCDTSIDIDENGLDRRAAC